MNSGIYRITNIINGKFYVGQTIDLIARKSSHFVYLRGNNHHNPKLQAAYNKYGAEAFVFEALERVDRINLAEREAFWVTKLNAIELGYNIKEGGRLGGKPGKVFEWKNLCTGEEINSSIPDLARKEGLNDKLFYDVVYGKCRTAYGWTLKSNTDITKARIQKRVFLSIKNHVTGEIYENLSVKEATELTGRSSSAITCLARGQYKRSGDWVLIDYDPAQFNKKKSFKHSEHFKHAVSRWRLTILDSLTGKTYADYRTGQLTELTGIPTKRWLELASGRKKTLRNRYSLVSSFRIEKASPQVP